MNFLQDVVVKIIKKPSNGKHLKLTHLEFHPQSQLSCLQILKNRKPQHRMLPVRSNSPGHITLTSVQNHQLKLTKSSLLPQQM